MGRILVVSGGYFVEHAAKDLGVVRELIRRGHQVTHLVVSRDIPPPFPRPVVEQDPEFRAVNSQWADRLSGAVPYLPQCDVVLIPGHKGADRLSDWAHRLGKIVVQHQNHGGVDAYNANADLVAAKGPYFADYMRQQWGMAEDTVVATGCVQYDAAFRPEVLQITRPEFCQIYGLDPAKRIAVWLPTREDRQHRYYEWSTAKYRAVCEAITQSSNHSLIIKPHPADYPSPYLPPRSGPHWWDTVFSGAPVLRAEHGYVCFHNCDVALANWSTTGIEFPMFRRPFLYVDVAENPRIHHLKALPNLGQPMGFYKHTLVPGFVGQVCTSEELPEILERCNYDVSDPTLYDEHVARFLTRADGKAYERVADLVERGLTLSADRPDGVSPAAVAGLYLQVFAEEARRRLHELRHPPKPFVTPKQQAPPFEQK